jgi:hypothetical protein
MFRRETNNIFKTLQLITLLCIAVLAGACSKTGQPAPSNNSTASTLSAPSSAAPGGGEFEGIVAMKMDTGNQKEAIMTYFLKSQHTRIEMKLASNPEGQGVMLWDLQAGKMTTLIPSKKMYMTMDLKETAEGLKDAAKEMKKSGSEEVETKFPKLTATGKQETIAGYPCEHWLMGDEQNIDMCIAKGLGYFGMGGQMGGGGSLKNLIFNPKLLASAAAHPEWVKFLQGGAFPLKLTTMEDGKVKMTMEAARIERKSLDESLFTIPADYKELNMQNMMGGKK